MKELNIIERPALDAFLQVCLDLPADEMSQIEKINGEPYDAGEVAATLLTCGGPRWAITTADGNALVVTGATFLRSGVYQVWYLARPVAWTGYGEEVTNITQGLIQMMFHDFSAHRLEVICLASRKKARHWYEKHLGLQFEGLMAKFCADQSDAALYSAIRGD